MTAETLPRPDPTRADADGPTHTVCCDPDRALCGADVPGAVWRQLGLYPADECAACADLDVAGVSCGRPLCRLRLWLRRRRCR